LFHTVQIFLLLIVSFTLMAKNSDNECYIDRTYNLISGQVIDSSNYIDDAINNMLTKPDSNKTILKAKKRVNKENSVDSFFRTKKFTTETEDTYISVKLNSDLHSLYPNKFNIGVTARIPLSKSTKRYNLFINSFKKGETTNSNSKINHLNKESGTEIGVNYFATLAHKIKSRYSLGVNGLNLFTLAKYSIEKNFHSWNILSTQEFRYSFKNLFEEETDIYFDKHLCDSRLFRIALLRGTRERDAGMDYSFMVQHFWIFSKTAALNLSQLFSGNTKYKYKRRRYRGITNYTTALNFRKTAFRKWFYYGIRPSINFNKERNYRANYALNFYLELYFGVLKH